MQPSLARLVHRQHGVLTREQALASCSVQEVRRHLRSGRWRRTPWRGLYVDGDLPDELPILVRAASLALGGDLVACHTTAATLWGFDIRDDHRARTEDLHFLGPPDLDNRTLSGLRVHPSSLGTADAVLRDGVWCTPPARTACDVVRLGAPMDALAVLDAALRSRTCDPARLAAARDRLRGLRGVTLLDRALPHADRRAASPMESRMRWRFLAAGLPAPDLQVRVGTAWHWREMDLAWREHRVGAEYDGQEAHMTPGQLRSDRERHNWLTERDWLLLHFTGGDVYRRHRAMVATVARHLAARRGPTIMA